ncbi:heavy metal-associated isoprenylated plant protein 1-like [Capsicum annuum]|uniref:heavy metal-associated isoprenylated plant protein 1-like n=1 Tax=Capsicum annuum TaxID=4072 RepID=UPI001FB18F13|nr:heavy metal-associated isoprenylated plant protein 1-like [Capsicum annuum]
MKIEENGAVYKVTMTGKFDPLKLQKKMEKELKKTVKLISPKLDIQESEMIEHKYKCNEVITAIYSLFSGAVFLSLTTAVFKLALNYDECNEKIHRIITRTGGCRNMKMDWENNLVTVTGTIDVKSLAESLRYHLRKNVEILMVNDGGGGSGIVYPRSRTVTGDHLYRATELFSDENPNACIVL